MLVNSLVNGILGPSVLLFPLNFFQAGGIFSMLFVLVISIISYFTCKLTYSQTDLYSDNYLPVIKRRFSVHFGSRFAGNIIMIAYWVCSIFELIAVVASYFISLVDQVYSAVTELFNLNCPSENEIVFNNLCSF